MGSVYGKNIKISLFGESHGKSVGCVIDGLPPGLSLNTSFIERRLLERQRGAIRLEPYRKKGNNPSSVFFCKIGDSETSDSPGDHSPIKALSEEYSSVGSEKNLRVDDDFSGEIDLSGVLTKRREDIAYRVDSGLSEDGICTGAPLCVFFENRDIRREDYSAQRALYRPGHADYVSAVRSGGFADLSGGGHFSGRLTAPLVFAGAICEQILSERGVEISAEVESVGGIVIAQSGAEGLSRLFSELEEDGDSVGCKIKVRIEGMPLGVGAPFFDTLEGEIAKAVFAVPAVKAIEFGTGFEFASKRGSEVVDAFLIAGARGEESLNSCGGEGGAYAEESVNPHTEESVNLRGGESAEPELPKSLGVCAISSKIVTEGNHNGGINGGISNGMPIVFSVAVKPASGIGMPIRTLNFETMKEDVLTIGGRHDRCIGFRALPGITAATAIVLADWIKEIRI